jgi:lipopolysaccharide transport system permease protein
MIMTLSNLFRARDLLWSWTLRTIRARYQQSILGGLWMIIQPVATVAIFTIIFTRFVPVDTGGIPYVVFSYVAVIPWTFLSSSLTDMSTSLVQNLSLVTKIYFPREALPLAAMLARLLDFAIAAIVLVVLILIYQVPIFPIGWLYLPLILLIQIGLVLGVGLLLASLNVFFRDVQSFLTLGIQLWFYASPIIYPVDLVPSQWISLYYLNPMAGILEAYRAVLLYQRFPGESLFIAGLEALVLLILGYWFFKRVEFKFADII